MSPSINCPLDLPDGQEFGVFANAFRIIRDVNGDYLLDFCMFSAEKNHARVVARVRVRGDFLVGIGQRLIATAKAAVQQARGKTPPKEDESILVMDDGLLKNAKGQVLILKLDDEGEN